MNRRSQIPRQEAPHDKRTVYDFESIKVMLPAGMAVMPESIGYKDKKDDEVINGVSSIPVGAGGGEYSGECEIGFKSTKGSTPRRARQGAFIILPMLTWRQTTAGQAGRLLPTA
jgi:hypothetical protein